MYPRLARPVAPAVHTGNNSNGGTAHLPLSMNCTPSLVTMSDYWEGELILHSRDSFYNPRTVFPPGGGSVNHRRGRTASVSRRGVHQRVRDDSRMTPASPVVASQMTWKCA